MNDVFAVAVVCDVMVDCMRLVELLKSWSLKQAPDSLLGCPVVDPAG
jgi:hypothetical protein